MNSVRAKISFYIPLLGMLCILGAGFFLTPGDLPGFVFCWFKRIYTLDCPGCGMTRACLLIPRGRFSEAVHLNAASPLFYALILMLCTQWIAMRKKLPGLTDLVATKAWRFVKLSLVTLAIVVGLIHWGIKVFSTLAPDGSVRYLP